MDTKVNYAAVGAFVLMLGVALLAGILWLSVGFGHKKEIQMYLAIVNESVAGLNVDAPVKYLGVTVGKVKSIQLNPAQPEQVVLQFAIEKSTPIKLDTVAVLKTQGLTGIAYVELSGSTAASPYLQVRGDSPYPIIGTKPSLSTRLENVLTTVLANLDRTSANVNAMFSDENRLEVKKILANSSLLIGSLADQRNEVHRLIHSATMTADTAARIAPQIEPVLVRISNASDALEKMADEAKLASKSAKQAMQGLDGGIHQITDETLPELERLLVELNALSASVKRLSDQTQRNPASLLRGRQTSPLGPGERVKP
ncbi:MlaD family protein [Undibacterium sp. Ji22W]|uniref:MlaD family protein n=1 Tax=Undibacterium sp. Ji22W TaxID=3413038 RepID=UPI003BF1EC55